MAQNVIICCDGTNNQFGSENTNVVRVIRSLDRTPGRQRLYYDPGVGTLPEAGWHGKVRQWLSTTIQQVIGKGLMTNVIEAYTFLMNYWEPGSPVYLFGFSRGAYTIRVLAAMLHIMGLLPRGNENLLPYLKRYCKSIRETTDKNAPTEWEICNEFRRTFSRDVGHDRHFPIHFLGLWDTVSSIGWFWEPKSFPFTRHNPSIDCIYHAVSIDERRAFFRQNLMEKDRDRPDQDFHERWFPGDHSDTGGGYPASAGGLWRCSFDWIMHGAVDAGLLVDDDAMNRVLVGAPAEPWAERQHDLLSKVRWKLCELIPKRTWNYVTKTWEFRCNRFRPRHIPDGSIIDQSALFRLRKQSATYRPRNFSQSFVDDAGKIDPIPNSLAFAWGRPSEPNPEEQHC